MTVCTRSLLYGTKIMIYAETVASWFLLTWKLANLHETGHMCHFQINKQRNIQSNFFLNIYKHRGDSVAVGPIKFSSYLATKNLKNIQVQLLTLPVRRGGGAGMILKCFFSITLLRMNQNKPNFF